MAGGAAALVEAIRASLPDLRLETDPLAREAVRRDETPDVAGGLPAAVAFPTTTAEVQALVRLAAVHRVPIVPRGAGTGLSGGASGIEDGLTISFARMDRILEIDRENLVATVQPGVVTATLRAAAEAVGCFYPPDPASYETCTIGGNIATNAGGLCCVKYGQTRASVLGLEVVLADGSVIRTGGKNVKDVAGYGLTQLFVGSMGTLGLVTEALLRLRPAPAPPATLLAFFGTLEEAGTAVSRIVAEGVDPVVLELLDGETVRAVEDVHALGLDRDAAALLLVELDLAAPWADEQLARAEAICRAAGATSSIRSAGALEADLLRAARRLALRALETQGIVHAEDIGVPRARLADLLRAIEAIADRHGVRIATFGHAGDGNVHPNLVFDRAIAERDPAAMEAAIEAVRTDLYAAALAVGGTVTAEHGIGVTRRAALERQVGPEAVAVMRRLKAALDPLGILSPGRVV